MTDPTADHAALLREELADLDAQVDAGDLDVATADSLRAKYTAELAANTVGWVSARAVVNSHTHNSPSSSISKRQRRRVSSARAL